MNAVIRACKYVLLGAVLSGAVFAGGFLLFVDSIQRDTREPQAAEGIVALTGGKARIGRAVELLARGHAKRLLISGVNPSTRASELQRLVPRGAEFFPCCVDLGRAALDTRGNAVETSAWAQKNDFSSLIVVTSSYHMPRTLVEFAWAMPQMQLIPYSVTAPSLRIERWWVHQGTRRLLFFEYVKYLNTLAQYSGARMVALTGLNGAARSAASAN